ncbi:translational elongation factor EF-1 alpha [Puccinia graminis f. sp. tritici]|uniref:Translational elongation factor EF-1 alpha n=1 Tax=Puccinia graminis f. sp. tritici TaxID=56615 RepID=A0A5B0NKB5_PUCGR|nr:translational elongation factor EF-1 alpha [Puccinia graminis f. sp. tritici]
MRTLSGGQNVRVILAAATWRRPHDVVILDEPIDYSDRGSLFALIESLKTFEGGVLVITHNTVIKTLLVTTGLRVKDLDHRGKDEEEEHLNALGN